MVLSIIGLIRCTLFLDIYNSTFPRIKLKPITLSQKKTTPLTGQVRETIAKYKLFTPSDCIIIAVSGGSDSIGLLHTLSEITSSNTLFAIYVDHGLRPDETTKEKELIAKLCRRLGIDFAHSTVDVSGYVSTHHCSVEEGARLLRYRALEEKRIEYRANHIAVGHTADDQVEEFFLRLIRGTGMHGLSGMRPKRDKIIRPLLEVKKSLVEEYLREKKIPWCLDSSNFDESFLRNRIRHSLLPTLTTHFNPSIDQTVIQTMNILREDEQLLSELSETGYSLCVSVGKDHNDDIKQGQSQNLSLNLPTFLIQPTALQRRILEKCFWKLGIRPTFNHIITVTDFCTGGATGKELHLSDGVRVYKHRQTVAFSRPLKPGITRGSTPALPRFEVTVSEPGEYMLEGIGKCLRIQKAGQATSPDKSDYRILRVDGSKLIYPLLVRGPLPGERFHPYNGVGTKKVSRFFNDKKINKSLRASWPVILSAGRIVALAGLEIDHHFRISTATTTVVSISLENVSE